MTVTAKLADGYEWASPTPAGWTSGAPCVDDVDVRGHLERRGVVHAGDAAQSDGDPGGVCRWCGATSDGDIADDAGDDYRSIRTPPHAPGTTVVVTATVGAGFAWVNPLPGPWKPGVPATTKATFTVIFAAVTCETVSPGPVTVQQPSASVVW